MAIKRLRDDARTGFPCIGKLRKGDEKKDEKRPGQDLDYFRFTSDDPEVVRLVTEEYGEQPQEIDLFIPHAKIDDAFSSWQEDWKAGGLVHRCDGETCVLWLKPDGKYSREPKECPGGCKEVGRLSMVLPCLYRAGYVGYVTFETHSINDILGIYGSLKATVEAKGREDLLGIGFTLKRVERAISTPGPNGKRVRRDKWMVDLEPAQDWVLAQLEVAKQNAMPQIQAGTLIDDVTGEVLSIPDGTERAQALDRMGGVGMPFPSRTEPVEAEVVEPEPEAPQEPAGWPAGAVAKFWEKASSLGLSEASVLNWFQINDMADYTGTMREAANCLADLQEALASHPAPAAGPLL